MVQVVSVFGINLCGPIQAVLHELTTFLTQLSNALVLYFTLYESYVKVKVVTYISLFPVLNCPPPQEYMGQGTDDIQRQLKKCAFDFLELA